MHGFQIPDPIPVTSNGRSRGLSNWNLESGIRALHQDAARTGPHDREDRAMRGSWEIAAVGGRFPAGRPGPGRRLDGGPCRSSLGAMSRPTRNGSASGSSPTSWPISRNPRPSPTRSGASSDSRKKSTTRRSPTTPKPFASIPRTPMAYARSRRSLDVENPARQGDRRFHRSHPPRSEDRRSLRRSWLTPGSRRTSLDKALADLDRSDPARSRIDASAYSQPRQRLAASKKEPTTRLFADLDRGHPARSPGCRAPISNRGSVWVDQEGQPDKAIADLHRGHPTPIPNSPPSHTEPWLRSGSAKNEYRQGPSPT